MRLLIIRVSRATVADINNALREDGLQHRIARTLPLDQIAKGNEIVEEGTCRGGVVLTID